MNTNVNVVHACCLSKILLEVLHVCNKQLLLACEILINLTVLIEHMYDDDLLLLLTAPGLLEAVMNATLPASCIAVSTQVTTWIRGTTTNLAHATTCLLLLQVLRPEVARLRVKDHRWRNLLGRLLQALLIAPEAPSSSC